MRNTENKTDKFIADIAYDTRAPSIMILWYFRMILFLIFI